MKTTNYQISKQLLEAGFRTNEENQIWNYKEQERWSMPVFDLETILEALPKQHDFFSRGIGKYELRIWYHEGKAFVGYQNYAGFDKVMTFEQEQNESLADTAARLWLKLKKENLA